MNDYNARLRLIHATWKTTSTVKISAMCSTAFQTVDVQHGTPPRFIERIMNDRYPAIDLSDYSLAELRLLSADVGRRINVIEKVMLAAARRHIEQIAFQLV